MEIIWLTNYSRLLRLCNTSADNKINNKSNFVPLVVHYHGFQCCDHGILFSCAFLFWSTEQSLFSNWSVFKYEPKLLSEHHLHSVWKWSVLLFVCFFSVSCDHNVWFQTNLFAVPFQKRVLLSLWHRLGYKRKFRLEILHNCRHLDSVMVF